MNYDFKLEKPVKKLGVIKLNQNQYEYLCKNTTVFPFVFNNRWIARLCIKKEEYILNVFSTGMEVKERLINIDTGIVKLRIKYFDGLTEKENDFDGSILSVYGVKTLYNYGVRFLEKDVAQIVKYLINSEANAQISRLYSKTGWDNHEGRRIFKGYYAMDKDGRIPNLSYSGSLDLEPKGCLNEWLSMVETEVCDNIPMTVVLLLGFASPILALLNEKYDIGAMMFNLSNHSSKGKTTAAMLASSVFSNPLLNRGCVVSFNATENALVQFISECQGCTVVIDEVGISNSSNFTRLMYTICNGRSKMRLSGDSTQKEVKEFSSVIITTAEFDLIDEDMPNGIKARVFEIKDTLTSSAENSERIKKIIIENHGVAGEVYTEYLLQKSTKIFEDYENYKKLLCDECKDKKDISERIFSKLAVIVTTAKYVNEAFDLNINISNIIDYILKLEKKISSEVKPEERLIEIIRQEVSRNNTKYKIDGSFPPGTCYGAIRRNGDYSEIQLTETTFKNIIDDYHITGWRGILKKLKAEGVLITEPDRLIKRVVLVPKVGKQKCYCFKIKNETENETENERIKELRKESYSISIRNTRNIIDEISNIDDLGLDDITIDGDDEITDIDDELGRGR